MRRLWFVVFVAMWLSSAGAQLPGTAVDLAKVKIPETQKSVDVCPVHLKPSAANLPAWSHEGVHYRGCQEGDAAEFAKSPGKYIEAARRQRWINNFMLVMSTVWCPVTDQLTPGGLGRRERHNLNWEVCCQFCEEQITDKDVDAALDRLKKRAGTAYDLTRGRYVEGASSPLEGAIIVK